MIPNFDELFGNNGGPVEPNADIRGAAILMFEFYTAYVGAGFTPEQAMQLCNATLAATIASQRDK